MDVIILGAGKVGTQLGRQLIHEEKEVTIIEKDPQKAKNIANLLDCMVINEEGNNARVLIDAGIKNADYFISVTESDEVNLIACGIASTESDQVKTIARVRNIEYSTSRMRSQSLLGIDQIFNSEIETAKAVVQSIEHGAMSNVMQFADVNLQMRNLTVTEDSPLVNQSLIELRSNIDADFLVPIIIRDDSYVIPSGETQIKENDLLYLLASRQDFDRIFQVFGKPKLLLNNIAIIGCGKQGCYIADYLGEQLMDVQGIFGRWFKKIFGERGKKLHLVESDYERCKYLNEHYPNALVTHGDIADESLWEEELLTGSDLLITSTGNQELNLITSMYAKKMGIARAIALVQTKTYQRIGEELGIDVTISVNNVLVNSIMKLVRRGDVRSLYPISGSPFEIIEFRIKDNSVLSGKAISSLRLPKNTLVILVLREETSIIPHGGLEIRSGDHLFLVTRSDTVNRLESLFDK